eukprot:scaffold650906_cov37-Prasinocladus_malaysianus.AAC.1
MDAAQVWIYDKAEPSSAMPRRQRRTGYTKMTRWGITASWAPFGTGNDSFVICELVGGHLLTSLVR